MLTNPIPLGFPSVSSCFMLPPPLPVTSCHNTTRYPEKKDPSFGVHTLCLRANPTPEGGYFFGTHFTKCHYKYYLLVERSQAGISPIGPLPTRTGMCMRWNCMANKDARSIAHNWDWPVTEDICWICSLIVRAEQRNVVARTEQSLKILNGNGTVEIWAAASTE